MGPDGEIIQLSFWGSEADADGQQLLDDITRGRGKRWGEESGKVECFGSGALQIFSQGKNLGSGGLQIFSKRKNLESGGVKF